MPIQGHRRYRGMKVESTRDLWQAETRQPWGRMSGVIGVTAQAATWEICVAQVKHHHHAWYVGLNNTSRAVPDEASPWMDFAVRALGSKCTPALRTSAMGAPRIHVHPLSFVLSIVPMGMTKAPRDSAAGDHMCMPGSVYFLHTSAQH